MDMLAPDLAIEPVQVVVVLRDGGGGLRGAGNDHRSACRDRLRDKKDGYLGDLRRHKASRNF
jgi:hypothetical protein